MLNYRFVTYISRKVVAVWQVPCSSFKLENRDAFRTKLQFVRNHCRFEIINNISKILCDISR